MEDPPKRSLITGEIDIKTLIAFVFGAIFIITILVFTAMVKNPSPTEIWTYRIILALAAAGVAAILPGFIDIKYKGFVQAGGAIGVFVLILLAFPAPDPAPKKAEAESPQAFVWPTEDPEFATRKYVDLVDNGKLLEAYEAIDKGVGLPWTSFETSYKAGRIPLGAVVDRRQTGAQRSTELPGRPKGGYAVVTYQTKFANEQKCREEVVTLRAMPDKTWRVSKHDSSPQQIDCIGLGPVGPVAKG
jgi:hypothetical protein